MTKPSELAAYMDGILKRVLDNSPDVAVASAARLNYMQAAQVRTLVNMVDSIDAALVEEWLDVGRRASWREIRNRLANSCEIWNAERPADRRVRCHELKFEHIFRLRELVELIRGDEATPSAERRFLFVADQGLRESLTADLASMERLIRLGEWKAATVLGGSIVEALLLDQLEQRRAEAEACGKKKGLRGDMSDWRLDGMIQCAFSIGAIDDQDRQACALAQGYRNLIHPGRERAKHPCGEHTAKQADATVLRLLGKWA